ncbi:MAG: ATP-binding protein, partial [Gemmatimonadota bacterium]|nr:ATP-binding protein [Gemmatimonadota bacterium]
MRLTPAANDLALQAILDPRRLLQWIYVGRLSLVSAILLAAVIVWHRADTDPGNLLIASLAFAVTTLWTGGSLWYVEIYGKQPGPTFSYLQTVYDLVLVTAIVHATGGTTSPFAALYILVIASASLLLPAGGGLLMAALGNVLYFADAVWGGNSPPTVGVWLQLTIFAVVALGSAYLGAKLQEAGAGKEELAAELTHVRLQASDILFNIRSGVVTIDQGGHLLYANPTATHLLGISFEQHRGRPVLATIAAIAPELAQALERTVVERVRTTRGEGTVATPTRRVHIGVTTTYMEGQGRHAYRTATAIFQDISDQKRIEVLRLRAERLEGVAELSASLAHEIKNPLASIRSAVEQLSRLPKTTEDEQTLSTLVMRETDRLSRLLSEFLDFARVRVAKTEPVDIGKVVRHAANLANAHPDRNEGVSVSCTVSEGLDVTVDGDEDLLHRAVFNLVLNAVQAEPAGGEVRVEAMPATSEHVPSGIGLDSGAAVAIRVSDSGAGIPAEIRDRLFDPFFTTKPGGSGLGLAVVHRAIEAHRGFVLVDSSPRGTRFTVVLPRSRSAAGPGAASVAT